MSDPITEKKNSIYQGVGNKAKRKLCSSTSLNLQIFTQVILSELNTMSLDELTFDLCQTISRDH